MRGTCCKLAPPPFSCKKMKSLFFPSVLVFAASFLSYWSSLDGGFVFDDHRGVLTNDDLDPSKTTLWEVFQHDFWGGLMSRKESHKSYRPLTVLTYRYLNFWFSSLEPYGYHLVNVLLHCGASVLVLMLCGCILGGGGCCLPLGGGLQLGWSTYAALLFAVHSVHTEAVASIVGRAEVLSCIFFLMSVLTYCKGVSEGQGPTLSPLPSPKWSYVVASVFLCLCSMLGKEQGIVSLGVCATFDTILHWEVFWEGLLSFLRTKPSAAAVDGREGDETGAEQVLLKEKLSIGGVVEEPNGNVGDNSGGSKQSKSCAKRNREQSAKHLEMSALAKRLGLLVVSGLALMWFRLSMNHHSQPIFKEEELKATFHPNRSVRIMSFSNIYVMNAWLLLSPSSLCCDWALGSIPLVTSLADPRNLWSLLLYAAILVLLIHLLLSRSNRYLMPAGMGAALLLLSFLPATGIVFRVGFVIAERVLYMPSIGLCLLVVAGARRIHHTLRHKLLRLLIHCMLAALIGLMAAKTHVRNKDWATDFALFESGVRVNPLNVKLRNNYGIELKSAGRVREALHQYQQSLAIDPDFAEVYMNLGNLFSDEKNYAEAAIYFEKAVEYPQMYQKTLNNLATTYFRLGKLDRAEAIFLESIQNNSDQPMTYNNLASLYGELKRYKESEKMFRKALKLNPHYTEAYFNLGTLFIQMGELNKGEKYLRKALELHPHHHGALNNLKVIEHYRRTEDSVT